MRTAAVAGGQVNKRGGLLKLDETFGDVLLADLEFDVVDAAGHRGAGFVLLLDPDCLQLDHIEDVTLRAKENGVDIFFIGGTLLLNKNFEEFVRKVKECAAEFPVILFPGSIFQISRYADAILYLSVISGRNP